MICPCIHSLIHPSIFFGRRLFFLCPVPCAVGVFPARLSCARGRGRSAFLCCGRGRAGPPPVFFLVRPAHVPPCSSLVPVYFIFCLFGRPSAPAGDASLGCPVPLPLRLLCAQGSLFPFLCRRCAAPSYGLCSLRGLRGLRALSRPVAVSWLCCVATLPVAFCLSLCPFPPRISSSRPLLSSCMFALPVSPPLPLHVFFLVLWFLHPAHTPKREYYNYHCDLPAFPPVSFPVLFAIRTFIIPVFATKDLSALLLPRNRTTHSSCTYIHCYHLLLLLLTKLSPSILLRSTQRAIIVPTYD